MQVTALTVLCLVLASATVAHAQARPSIPDSARTSIGMMRARGTFDVKLDPQAPDDYADGKTLGRMSIDKQLRGDLDGRSRGQMLTALTEVKGSAAYVAIERVTGTLQGRSGTFVLVHRGVMSGGDQQLLLTVVPDSGTGELAGLAGTMTIRIDGRQHFYEMEYTLPAAR